MKITTLAGGCLLLGIISALGAVHDELDDVQTPSAPLEIKLGKLVWKLPPQYAKLEGDRLVVDIPASAGRRTAMAMAALDPKELQGRAVAFTIATKVARMVQPETPYFGFKFQLQIDYADGTRAWPSSGGGSGDWESTRTIRDVLPDKPIRRVVFQLGIQESTGHAEFDLATLKGEHRGTPFKRVNQNYRVKYPDETAHRKPLRGVMLAGSAKEITEDHFATLEKWGATLARFQMSKGWNTVGAWLDCAEYDRYVDGELDLLERNVLPWAAKHGVKICIDLHAAPGARVGAGKELRMCHEKKYFDQFVATWRKIATRFREDPRIYGFDLVNEPNQHSAAPYSYLHVQLAAARAIREIDRKTPIIVESNAYDSAPAFEYLSPFAMDNIIYQAHCYLPMEFTHQGVFTGDRKNLVAYPNEQRGWNKDFIRRTLEPVRAFAERHGAKIYIGEFSAITWAPGAENYIRDAIEIFEEYGWDWSYHAFREWPGWSVEHTWVRQDSPHHDTFVPSDDNPRLRVLKAAFRK